MKRKSQALLESMRPGKVYRQSELQEKWPNASHDLRSLLEAGRLEKVSAGLYFRPKESSFGQLAPESKELVRSFLRDENFLLVDTNQYNSLVPGLTQLSFGPKVLNRRRHGHFRLAGFPFDFRVRRNFPKKLSKSFLLVDLLDSVRETEDGSLVKQRIKSVLSQFDRKKLIETAKQFGNRSTQLFLERA